MPTASVHSFLRRNFEWVESRNIGCFYTYPQEMLIFSLLIKRKAHDCLSNDMIIIAFEVRERKSWFLLGVLCIIGFPVQLKGRFFWDCICVDTHLPRFEALAYVLPHFDALTHVVIRVSSAFIFQTFVEVCYSVFVKRSFFKSVLNLRKAYILESLLSICVYESSKAFIFQTFAESLHTE